MDNKVKENYNINYFNFKKMNEEYLITNDLGRFLFIDKDEMRNVILKDFNISDRKLKLLQDNYFIYRDKELFIEKTANEFRKNKNYLNEGTQLHIFVLTTFCNLSCIYCQASSYNNLENYSHIHKFMNNEIAEKAVDIALQSPSENLTFEFQGGEPIANFDVLKHIVNYTKRKNKLFDKKINYSLVSNLTMLTTDMIKFLLDNEVEISTSVDGPKQLHNINRKYYNKDSLTETKDKIEQIRKLGNSKNRVQAIETTTKFSLNYSKEIVDEYISLGLNMIFVRPLTPMGYASSNWNDIGYTEDEFLTFYENLLNYTISLASIGINISEGHSRIFLKKILKNSSMNRSPCGGVIGQIAYNYDGNIYSCDEGRMLAEMGDKSFKLGNVFENNLKDLVNHPVCKTMAVSSCLELIPDCEQCAYSPYCGVCPVCNYAQYNNLFAPNANSYRCKIYKGMLDIIFKKIQENDKKTMKVFNDWIKDE